MKVLVTGANGHIGAHVVRRLIDEGHQVRAMIRPHADVRGLEGVHCERVIGDVMDEASVLAGAEGVDAIIHLAAVYKTQVRDPDEIVEPAIQGARNVFAAAKAKGIPRVVYTSSVASVGFSYDPQHLLTGDDWNRDPHNPYYLAKTRSEEAAQTLAQQYGIHLVVLCPALVLGPLDYRVTPSNQLVMDWLNGRGQTYTGGLNLVDVRDVAAAHVAALTAGTNGRRYVVGGENLEVRQIGHLLDELVGIRPLHLGFSRGLMLWSTKWIERLCHLARKTPPATYDLVYEVVERYCYLDTRETNETFRLRPRQARETLRDCIEWLLQQGRLKPSVAEKVRARLKLPHE